MFFGSIIHDYFIWHYTQAWSQIWRVWHNFMFVVSHFFSISQLMRSWFEPFKRTTEGRGERFNLEDLASYIIINTLSRVLGALTRSVIILIGIAALAATVLGGLFV